MDYNNILKGLFITFWVLICFFGRAEAGREIIAVQSIKIPPYDQAIKGFQSVCNTQVKKLVLSEQKALDVVKKIRQERPRIVVAIGMDALIKVKEITRIPIVYLMVLNPRSILSGQENITGVTMNIPQKKQLHTLLRLMPSVERVGLLYDPDRTGHLVEKARAAAEGIGITLIAKDIYNSKDVPLSIEKMKGEIDAFWMLPDITVITPETVEFLFLFSLENNIPVLTFSDKYLRRGALLSIGIDAFDLGIQAGEMANKLLSGNNVADVHQVQARKATIQINQKIARKLKIHIDKTVIRESIITD